MSQKIVYGLILMVCINSILFYYVLRTRSAISRQSTPAIIKRSVSVAPATIEEKKVRASDLQSCFNFYDYGKAKAFFSADKTTYQLPQDSTIRVSGSIANENTFPITGVALYAQIRRKNLLTYARNGHYLVHTTTLATNLNIQPQEQKELAFEIPLDTTFPVGEYQIQYYIRTPDGFHYGGRSFLEEDMAGTTNFTLEHGSFEMTYWDIDALTVNSKPVSIRGITQELPAGPVLLRVPLVDTRVSQTPVSANIVVYAFEDDMPQHIVATSKKEVTDGVLTYEFNPPFAGAYVFTATSDAPYKSVFKYRFASEHEESGRIRFNDVGISAFPAGKDGVAWVCFHSPHNTSIADASISLSVLDAKNTLLEKALYTGVVSPEVLAISVPLAKVAGSKEFTIVAEEIQDRTQEKELLVKKHYTCDMFGSAPAHVYLEYEKGPSQSLKVYARTACDEKITAELFIDRFIVKKRNTILIEKTHIKNSGENLLTQKLAEGAYTAEIEIDRRTHTLDFIVMPQPVRELESKNKWYLYSIPALLFAVAVGLAVYVVHDKKKKTQ